MNEEMDEEMGRLGVSHEVGEALHLYVSVRRIVHSYIDHSPAEAS